MRFPGFTDEWRDSCLLSDCDINPKSSNLEDKFVYLDLESVEKGELRKYKIIERLDAPSRAQRVLSNNDVLFQCVRPYQQNNYLYRADNSRLQWVASTGYAQLRVKNSSPEFIYHLLSTQSFTKKVIVRCTGSNYPAINSEDLSTIHYQTCSLPEQKKIANFLTLLDERIATQNKIIEDLKKLKSAIIDRLYSEVKGESYMYSDLFTVVTERNNKRLYNKVIAASQEFGMVERETLNLKVQFDEESINTYKIINSGDYVIHLRSFQGGFAFSRLQGICSPAYIILRPNEQLEYSFFENYFTSSKFINSLRLVTYGIRDGRSINVEEWLSMKVTLPSKDEQKRIIQTIQSIQNKLINEIGILSKLESQRRYLLQTMFI